MQDLFILDPTNFMRIAVLDDYVSLVWAERFAEIGDFTLTVNFTKTYQTLLKNGVMLSLGPNDYVDDGYAALTGVEEVMIIEKTEVKDDDGGGTLLILTGRSLLSVLEKRVTGPALTPSGSAYDNGAATTADAVAIQLVTDSCGATSPLSSNDVIPNLNFGQKGTTMYVVDLTIKVGQLYEKIKELADAYDFGFALRIKRVPDSFSSNGISNFNVWFTTRLGTNRSIQPNPLTIDREPVLFSADLGTIDQLDEISSITEYYNAAYVYGKDKAVIVEDSEGPFTGWARKVLYVDASDLTGTTTSVTDKLTNRGLIALKKQKVTNAIDGVVPDDSVYKLGVHYYLGDYVQVRSRTGTKYVMQVMEYVRSFDANGSRGYPTLTATDKTFGGGFIGIPLPGGGSGGITLPIVPPKYI